MKNSKKKLFAVALAVCLIAILSFTTLAWFTDSAEATNTFTIGSIEIVQHEKQDENDDGTLEDFVNDKVLLPVVDEDPAKDPNYKDKIVYVENTGKNPAYVRTHIAIPASLNGYLNLDTDTNNGWVFEYSNQVTISGVPHVVYTFRYDTELAIDQSTPAVLKGVYLYSYVDIKEATDHSLQFCKWNDEIDDYDFSGFVVQDAEGTTYKVNVLVTSQAVQSEGFADAETALDSAFGANTTPWGN